MEPPGAEEGGVPTTEAWWQQPGFPGVPEAPPEDAPAAPREPDVDRLRPLRPPDLDRRWFLDFHHPRPLVPLALSLVDDIATGSQVAARQLPLGVGGGFASRLVGPHVYLGAAATPAADPDRSAAAEADLDAYPRRFAAEWQAQAAELAAGYARLDAVDLATAPAADLAAHLGAARALHRRAWRIHFEVMYRLFALQHRFRGVCRDVGLGDVEAAALLDGDDNAIRAADRALADLAAAAGPAGVRDVLLGAPPGAVLPALRARPTAAGWLARLDDVLAVHGQRSDALSDLTAPSWTEDPEIPLALVRAALENGALQPPAPSGRQSTAAVLSRLSPAARARLAPALEDVRRANVAWWNEEHNAVIDLRVHLPVRRLALALALRWRTPRPDDVLMLTTAEVEAMLAGTATWAGLAPLADARREYLARWRGRRADLPGRLGSGPAGVDVVLDEILGASAQPPDAAPEGGLVLGGLGVSGGVATGPARVIGTAAELADLRAGEVLVCEATSPSWTSVFDRLAGCVCDAGGMLTHAAIISREYALPCVCAVGGATRTIRTGDVVEVDGTAGVVRVLARASAPGPPR